MLRESPVVLFDLRVVCTREWDQNGSWFAFYRNALENLTAFRQNLLTFFKDAFRLSLPVNRRRWKASLNSYSASSIRNLFRQNLYLYEFSFFDDGDILSSKKILQTSHSFLSGSRANVPVLAWSVFDLRPASHFAVKELLHKRSDTEKLRSGAEDFEIKKALRGWKERKRKNS